MSTEKRANEPFAYGLAVDALRLALEVATKMHPPERLSQITLAQHVAELRATISELERERWGRLRR